MEYENIMQTIKADAINAFVNSSISLCISKCCKQHHQGGAKTYIHGADGGGKKEIMSFQNSILISSDGKWVKHKLLTSIQWTSKHAFNSSSFLSVQWYVSPAKRGVEYLGKQSS